MINPAGLTRNVQITLGVAVVALNRIIYLLLFSRRSRNRKGTGTSFST